MRPLSRLVTTQILDQKAMSWLRNTTQSRGLHTIDTQGRSTLCHLLVDSETRLMYQGFTSKTATKNAIDSMAIGTNVVGGLSKGKGGTSHLGLPVFNTMREAVRELKPEATLVHIPAIAAASAIEQAIEEEVPLIVAIAEHIPVHDMLRVHEALRTQNKSRLLGPNTPGILAPGKSRIGIIPANQCTAGRVGIVSRSGTMIYEAIGATEQVGLGQSLVIGLGGDSMPGTTMVEALQVLLLDAATEAVILIGEIGGLAEFHAADLIKQYRSEARNPKPIISIISGRTAPPGRTMGHAGALLLPGDQGAEAKARALTNAGSLVLAHLGELEKSLREIFQE